MLGGERAAYGQEIIKLLATKLSVQYGRGYSWRNLMRMVKLAELHPDSEILSPLATKLTWANITEILTISDQAKRDFYLVSCAREGWTKRTLRERIGSKLYERTLASDGAGEGLAVDPGQLASESGAPPGIVFRDPYVLDFLGLDSGEIHAARYLTHDVRERLQHRLDALTG